MPCPTCGHTMAGLGYGTFHCSRCGTVSHEGGGVYVPGIVGRSLAFLAKMESRGLQGDDYYAARNLREAATGRPDQ